jgi:hypothetical protein
MVQRGCVVILQLRATIISRLLDGLRCSDYESSPFPMSGHDGVQGTENHDFPFILSRTF